MASFLEKNTRIAMMVIFVNVILFDGNRIIDMSNKNMLI